MKKRNSMRIDPIVIKHQKEFGSEGLIFQRENSPLYNLKINFNEKVTSYRRSSITLDKDVNRLSESKFMREDTFETKILSPDNLLQLNYHIRWHWSQFFEFLFYHFIFFFILGPMILVLWKKPGIILLKNMEFYGFTKVNIVQSFVYLTNLYCTLTYFLQDQNTVQISEIINLWGLIFNLCLIISAKYATFSKDAIQIYKTFIIDVAVKKKLQYLHYHTPQSYEARYVELYAAFKRNQFETSQFYLSFFTPSDNHFVTSIEVFNQELKKHHDSKYGVYQPEPLIQQKQQFYGYGIANMIINTYENSSQWQLLMIYSMIMSLMISLIPLFYGLHKGTFSTNAYHILYFVFTIISQTYCGFICLLFLLTSLRDIKKKKYLLIQCGFMMSPSRALWDEKKILPNLNITDHQSIMAWSMLRQICFDYGKQYTIRTQAFYSFIILYTISVTTYIILHLLEYMDIDECSLIYLSVVDSIFLVLILLILIEQAHINGFFQIYRNLIEDWINIIFDIQTMQTYYFRQKIVPNNFLHRKIVDSITEQIDDFKEADNLLELLQLTLNDELRHLNYDERNDSFQFYGIVITFEKLWAILVGFWTIMGFTINSWIQHH